MPVAADVKSIKIKRKPTTPCISRTAWQILVLITTSASHWSFSTVFRFTLVVSVEPHGSIRPLECRLRWSAMRLLLPVDRHPAADGSWPTRDEKAAHRGGFVTGVAQETVSTLCFRLHCETERQQFRRSGRPQLQKIPLSKLDALC